MEKSKPKLTEYLDVHQYLAELYKYRKQVEPGFSYESWAHELNIQHRSYLRQIVIGRRQISNTMAKQLGQRLNLSDVEFEYFETLIHYSKAKTPTQRNTFGKKLSQLIRTDVSQKPIMNTPSFVMTPIIPRIHALLSFDDAKTSIEEIMANLMISYEVAEEALNALTDLGLIENTTSGYRTLSSSFVVPDDLGKEWLLNYHRLSLADAQHATNLDAELRRYKSLLIALSPEEFKDYLDDLQEFTKQTLSKFNPSTRGDRHLFQINFNAHAVTASKTQIS